MNYFVCDLIMTSSITVIEASKWVKWLYMIKS